MSQAEQLRDELERAFVDEPATRPVERHLTAGRRALRRRRTVGAVAACTVVAALGATYTLGASGPDRDAGRIIASDPPSPSAPGPTWEDDTPIRYLHDRLQIRAGVVVHERIRNPYGYAPPRGSDAFDLTYEGQRMWIVAEHTGDDFGYSSSVPSAGWASFRAWVDDQVTAGGGGRHGYPATLRLTADGRVVPVAGAEVVQRTDKPDLGPTFAPAGATVGAAVVRPPDSVFTYFVVWRVIDGKLDVIYTPPRDSVGATFDELLNGARQRYASGEGLR